MKNDLLGITNVLPECSKKELEHLLDMIVRLLDEFP
jgi:hypothetical protein